MCPVATDELADLQLSPEEQEAERVEQERQDALAEAQAELDGEDAAAEGAEAESKTDELRENAGEAVGEMPPGEPDDSTVVHPDRIVVSGTAQGSQRKWNGKQPTVTLLKIGGVKMEVEGTFKKGERVRFSGEAVVVGEGSKDKLDKDTKVVVDAIETFDATVLDFEIEG